MRTRNSEGCLSSASDTVKIVINPIPATPVITPDGPTFFCKGNKVKLTSTSAKSYIWSTGQKSRIIDVDKDGIYSVKVLDENECQSHPSDPLKIEVNPLPEATITANGPLSFCEGEKRTLIANGGNSYLWSNGKTDKSILVSGEGLYNVQVSNQWGCTKTAEAEIEVWQTPSSIAGPEQRLKFAFETQLNAQLNAGDIGEWIVISGRAHIFNIHSPTSIVEKLSIGENKFLWRVTNGKCYDESELLIYVEDMFLPNVITPNNDGKNDYFIIENIPLNTELIIFDRFGKTRFHDTNYSNSWNGISNEGVELSEDTYFYILNLNNGIIKKGGILVKR